GNQPNRLGCIATPPLPALGNKKGRQTGVAFQKDGGCGFVVVTSRYWQAAAHGSRPEHPAEVVAQVKKGPGRKAGQHGIARKSRTMKHAWPDSEAGFFQACLAP